MDKFCWSPLYTFNSVNIFLIVRIPHNVTIFKMRSDLRFKQFIDRAFLRSSPFYLTFRGRNIAKTWKGYAKCCVKSKIGENWMILKKNLLEVACIRHPTYMVKNKFEYVTWPWVTNLDFEHDPPFHIVYWSADLF